MGSLSAKIDFETILYWISILIVVLPIVEKWNGKLTKLKPLESINDDDAKSLMMMMTLMIAKILMMTMTTMMMLTMMTMMLVREKWL